MAIDFVAASQESIYTDSPAVTDVPFTFAAWVNFDNGTQDAVFLFLGDKDEGNEHFRLVMRGAEAGDPISAHVRNAGANEFCNTSTGITVDAWHHAAGIFTNSTDRKSYIDGGSEGTATTDIAVSGTDRFGIGASLDKTESSWMDGSIAEVAIWNVALTTAELAILAKGFSPLFVRPQSLKHYLPLVRDYRDWITGQTFSANGTPDVVVHPPIIYPAAPYIIGFPEPVSTLLAPRLYGRCRRISTLNFQ